MRSLLDAQHCHKRCLSSGRAASIIRCSPVLKTRPCRKAAAAAARAASSRGSVQIVASLDYIATASDEGVLKLPARTELDAEEVKSVFNYPRWATQMHAEIFCEDDGSA